MSSTSKQGATPLTDTNAPTDHYQCLVTTPSVMWDMARRSRQPWPGGYRSSGGKRLLKTNSCPIIILAAVNASMHSPHYLTRAGQKYILSTVLCRNWMFGDIIQIGLSGVSSVWTTKDMFLHRLNPSVNVCGGLFVTLPHLLPCLLWILTLCEYNISIISVQCVMLPQYTCDNGPSSLLVPPSPCTIQFYLILTHTITFTRENFQD